MKRLVALALTLCMCFQSSIIAFANENNSKSILEKNTVSDKDFEKYEIKFDTSLELLTVNNTTDKEDVKRNQDNVLQAETFVKSLDLESSGNGHIEEACLSLLDEYYKDENIILTSFTVCVPKTRAAEEYYGTYNGRKYTTSYFAETTVEYKHLKDTNTRKIQAWFDGAVNFILLWGGSTVLSVGVGAIQAVSNLPPSFEVNDKAYTESYINVSATPRGFFTVDTDAKYGFDKTAKVRVYTDESGSYIPFFIFHPVDKNYDGAYCINGLAKDGTTDNYKNKTYNLKQCDSAYKFGASPVARMSQKAMSSEWR